MRTGVQKPGSGRPESPPPQCHQRDCAKRSSSSGMEAFVLEAYISRRSIVRPRTPVSAVLHGYVAHPKAGSLRTYGGCDPAVRDQPWDDRPDYETSSATMPESPPGASELQSQDERS